MAFMLDLQCQCSVKKSHKAEQRVISKHFSTENPATNQSHPLFMKYLDNIPVKGGVDVGVLPNEHKEEWKLFNIENINFNTRTVCLSFNFLNCVQSNI